MTDGATRGIATGPPATASVLGGAGRGRPVLLRRGLSGGSAGQGFAGSSANIYYENLHAGQWPEPSPVPTGVAVFAEDIAIRRYAEQSNNIVHWTELDRGGHFAAMEAPELLVGDVRESSAASGNAAARLGISAYLAVPLNHFRDPPPGSGRRRQGLP